MGGPEGAEGPHRSFNFFLELNGGEATHRLGNDIQG